MKKYIRLIKTLILAITALFILYVIPFTFLDLFPEKGFLFALAVSSVWALALWVLWKKYKMDKNAESVSKDKRIIVNILTILIVGWVWISLFASVLIL